MMGLEAGTVALIGSALSAAGAGASVYNQREALKDQESQALKGMDQQRLKQRQIDERLSGEIGALEQSNPDDERQASLDAYLGQLRANRSNAEGATTPGVSRYGEDTQLAKAGVQNYGQKLAGILSRIDATRDQRINESRGFDRAGSDVAGVAREASGNDFINRLRMSQIQPNMWLDAGARVAQGAGAGMAGYANNMGSSDDQLFRQLGNAGMERVPPNVWGGATESSVRRRLPVYNQRTG
jgi:hypothetical protein